MGKNGRCNSRALLPSRRATRCSFPAVKTFIGDSGKTQPSTTTPSRGPRKAGPQHPRRIAAREEASAMFFPRREDFHRRFRKDPAIYYYAEHGTEKR